MDNFFEANVRVLSLEVVVTRIKIIADEKAHNDGLSGAVDLGVVRQLQQR
jgi:hypothetical protein